jgi:hypothetical protein
MDNDEFLARMHEGTPREALYKTIGQLAAGVEMSYLAEALLDKLPEGTEVVIDYDLINPLRPPRIQVYYSPTDNTLSLKST